MGPPSGCYQRHQQAVPLEGQGEHRVRQVSVSAPVGDGGEWCPVHGTEDSRRTGDIERTSCKASTPAEERG